MLPVAGRTHGTSLPAGGLARLAVTPSAQLAAGPRDLDPSMEEPGLRAAGVFTGPCASCLGWSSHREPRGKRSSGAVPGPRRPLMCVATTDQWEPGQVWEHATMVISLLASSCASRFPPSPGAPAAAPPPVCPPTHTHTPCGLAQPCYSITMCCGVGRAKPSCRQHGGALQAALGQTRGLEAPRRPPVPQPDLPQKASGVPIGTTVCQHGHGFSLRTHWYPLHPTPFPLPPRHPALRSRNIPYPRQEGGRGRCWSHCLVTLPFSRAELGKVLAEERPVLPSQNWGEWVASGGLLRSEQTSSPGTRQLPGRAWVLCRAGLTPAALLATCEALAALHPQVRRHLLHLACCVVSRAQGSSLVLRLLDCCPMGVSLGPHTLSLHHHGQGAPACCGGACGAAFSSVASSQRGLVHSDSGPGAPSSQALRSSGQMSL